MEENRRAYNIWAEQYDTNTNRTRDVEALALRSVLKQIRFVNVLEIGCGTGKNSEWLVQHAKHVVAVDFSEEMLANAKRKVQASNISFIKADIASEWTFTTQQFDLLTFSLVLEHIENLEFIFKQASNSLCAGGHIYIGELHPYKQYQGTVARFDKEGERVELQCFKHHFSEFLQLAKQHNFTLIDFNERFDNDDKTGIPRIMTMLLQR